MLELVSAYAPFANGGIAVAPHVVERVRAADGKTLYTRATQTLGRIVDAALRRHDEHDDAARRWSAAPRASADLPGWQAAGKTGTSQDFRDAWFIGYTGASRHRRVARQRRQLADQEGDRRRPAGRNLEPVHEDRASRCCAVGAAGTERGRLVHATGAGPGAERRAAATKPAPAPPPSAAISAITAASISGCSTNCSAGAETITAKRLGINANLRSVAARQLAPAIGCANPTAGLP